MKAILSSGAMTFCLGALMLLAGCHRPTQADRDNRRLVEQLLTALTLQNKNLLAEADERRKSRRSDGELAEDDSQALEATIEKARGGDWKGALNDAYAFRRRRPFVERGQ